METLLALWTAGVENAPHLVGFILPPFVEILNRDVKKENERFLVAVVVCLLTAIFLHWKEVAYGTPEQVVMYTALIFTESQAVFQLYFAKSWFRGTIQEKIGAKREEVRDEFVQ